MDKAVQATPAGHKSHARALHRLADPLGIRCIVLVGCDIRLGKLRLYILPQPLTLEKKFYEIQKDH